MTRAAVNREPEAEVEPADVAERGDATPGRTSKDVAPAEFGDVAAVPTVLTDSVDAPETATCAGADAEVTKEIDVAPAETAAVLAAPDKTPDAVQAPETDAEQDAVADVPRDTEVDPAEDRDRNCVPAEKNATEVAPAADAASGA